MPNECDMRTACSDEEFLALESDSLATPDSESGRRSLVARVATMLDAPVLLLEQRAGDWQVIASAGAHAATRPIVQEARQTLATLSPGNSRIADAVLRDGSWTCLLLRHDGEHTLVLMVAVVGALSRALLEDLARRFGRALDGLPLPSAPSMRRQLIAAYTLPRRLARAAESEDAYRIVVEACAKTVGAQKGSIALYDRERDWLSVVATFGYPALLVQRLRIRPGDGVIGSVFQTGRPLRVDDIQRIAGGRKPRLRYRTRSFLSVPLMLRGEVVGVISVADPEGERFARVALRNLRALAHVASLAVDRGTVYAQARAFARVAAVDPLTGLFNRRYFLTRLHEEVERARRQSSALAVLMIDLDNFKQLNDRLGHTVGDAVLRFAGDVLRRSVRSFDVCARLGGDEFAILMPGSSPESAGQVGERIRAGVEASHASGNLGSDDQRVSASVGFASLTGNSAEDLMERADQALYVAKRGGKNRVHSNGEATP